MVVRERILAEGRQGSGKSYAWLSLAAALLEKQPDTMFRVIDTDDAIERMILEEFPQLDAEKGGNVIIYPVYKWDAYMGAQKILVAESKPGDWNVVDMAHMAWKEVQGHFIEQVFHQNVEDYFVSIREKLASNDDKKNGKKANKLDTTQGWLDWPVINKLYDAFMMPLVYQAQGHLWISTSVDSTNSMDSKEQREMYGPYGVKPRGQKDLAHQCHTEFLFQQDIDEVGSWEISTMKDRGRRYFDHTPLKNFPVQYYQLVCGWDIL